MSFQTSGGSEASRLISDGEKCRFVLLGGTFHSLQERFLALRRDNTLQNITRRTKKSYHKAQHSLFVFAKIAGNRLQAPPRNRRKIN
jgi:hypothetical protein